MWYEIAIVYIVWLVVVDSFAMEVDNCGFGFQGIVLCGD
jgi:hypothetical protein